MWNSSTQPYNNPDADEKTSTFQCHPFTSSSRTTGHQITIDRRQTQTSQRYQNTDISQIQSDFADRWTSRRNIIVDPFWDSPKAQRHCQIYLTSKSCHRKKGGCDQWTIGFETSKNHDVHHITHCTQYKEHATDIRRDDWSSEKNLLITVRHRIRHDAAYDTSSLLHKFNCNVFNILFQINDKYVKVAYDNGELNLFYSDFSKINNEDNDENRWEKSQSYIEAV